MIRFLTVHFGTIIISLLLMTAVISILINITKEKRKGKCIGCDCDCKKCPSSYR